MPADPDHPNELRAPQDAAEVDAWFLAEAVGFGGVVDPAFVEHEMVLLPRERMLGVWEDGACVATAGWYPFEVTVPGGRAVTASGVCDVAVLPGHRRRGHLTRMMRHLHDGARERGDTVAVLTASDGSIYQRFGYGIATTHQCWELDAAHARFRSPIAIDLHPELLVGVDGAELMHELWDRTRLDRPGTLSRSLDWWLAIVGPHEGWKGGGRVFTLVLRDGAGLVRGGASYRTRIDGDRGVQQWRIEPLEIVADAPDVEAQLVAELARLDHVITIAPRLRPIDDPLRWRLVDPRRLKVNAVVDLLWLCPLDVAGLLAARSYACDLDVVMSVVDEFDAGVEGTYRLRAAGGEARCEPVDDATPDLRLSSAALGSASLGGVGLAVLAAAGEAEERRPGALATADAAFRTPQAPFNSTFF